MAGAASRGIERARSPNALTPRVDHLEHAIWLGLLLPLRADVLPSRRRDCTYAGRNMADAHEAMHIRDDEFDALVDDIAKSLDKLKVPAAERAEALAILNQMKSAIVGH